MHSHGDVIRETYRLLFRLGTPEPPSAAHLRNDGKTEDATGWKVAQIIDPFAGRFAGLANGSFTLDDTARCESFAHPAPQPGCRCGFHAFHQRDDAQRARAQRWGSVLLKVELYGDIVRHRSGSRASEQVVTAVHPAPRCERSLCSDRTAGVVPVASVWVAACERHLGDGLSLADLHRLFAVDVTPAD